MARAGTGPAKSAGQVRCRSTFENAARKRGFSMVAGVDEVGRGALFGCVVAAAVVLPPDHHLPGLADSKLLTPEQREILAVKIQHQAVCWAVGAADAFEIDTLNILEATRLAMTRAVQLLKPAPDYLLLDAMRLHLDLPQESLIGGDARSRCIAAASILAKVHRDASLRKWAEVLPGYGLEHHKGYGTKQHLDALAVHGPTAMHRSSFAPVKALGSRFTL